MSVSELKRIAMEKLDEFNAGDVEENPVREEEISLFDGLHEECSLDVKIMRM